MPSLRIAINVDLLFKPVPGGQGRVIANLIKELAHIDQTNQYTLFSVHPVKHVPEPLQHLPDNFKLQHVPSIKPQLSFLAWHTLRWPTVDTTVLGQQDIVHATTPSIVPACKHARLIVTVYDLVCWRFPQGLKPWGRYYQRTGMKAAACEAAYITAISDATRQDFLTQFAGQVEPERVRTIPIAATSNLESVQDLELIKRVCERYNIIRPFIINVGTLEPRKNVTRLLKAYAALPLPVRTTHQLVIVGPYGWKVPALQQLVATLQLENDVIWTGYIPDNELSVLLSAATIFVYPSLYEGFGIPILEAMQCDVPIITSNISSMPEVSGNAALLVDPTNVEELTAAMQHLLLDENARTQLIERGRIQRTRFSYRHMAKEVLALYQTADKLPRKI